MVCSLWKWLCFKGSYAIRPLILSHILWAYFFLIWGVGVVKIVFRIVRFNIAPPRHCDDYSPSRRAPNTPEFAQPRLSRFKGRSSPGKGYKFGCVCSYMAGHEDAGVMTGHIITIGTNTPKSVPPRRGRPPFAPTQSGTPRPMFTPMCVKSLSRDKGSGRYTMYLPFSPQGICRAKGADRLCICQTPCPERGTLLDTWAIPKHTSG